MVPPLLPPPTDASGLGSLGLGRHAITSNPFSFSAGPSVELRNTGHSQKTTAEMPTQQSSPHPGGAGSPSPSSSPEALAIHQCHQLHSKGRLAAAASATQRVRGGGGSTWGWLPAKVPWSGWEIFSQMHIAGQLQPRAFLRSQRDKGLLRESSSLWLASNQ